MFCVSCLVFSCVYSFLIKWWNSILFSQIDVVCKNALEISSVYRRNVRLWRLSNFSFTPKSCILKKDRICISTLRPASLLKLENSYARGLQLFLKKRLWQRCFPVNFAKFFRTTFFRRTSPVAASRLFVSSFYSHGKLWFLAVEIFFLFWIEL